MTYNEDLSLLNLLCDIFMTQLTFLHWASLSSLVALITLSSRTPMKELPQVWKQLSVSVTQFSPDNINIDQAHSCEVYIIFREDPE